MDQQTAHLTFLMTMQAKTEELKSSPEERWACSHQKQRY